MTTFNSPNKRASTRLSTFSVTPTLAPSIAPSHLSYDHIPTSDKVTGLEKSEYQMQHQEYSSPMVIDMTYLHASIARLDEPRLINQRYAASDDKKDEINKLALGAKLDRALGRRMSGQDAIFTKDKAKISGMAIGPTAAE